MNSTKSVDGHLVGLTPRRAEEVLRQRALETLRKVSLVGPHDMEGLVRELLRKYEERIRGDLEFALLQGLLEVTDGEVLDLHDSVRAELGLPSKKERSLRVPVPGKDFENLAEQVLGRRRHKDGYSLERLVSDIFLLGASFGWDVSTLARAYLQNEVSRALLRLAGMRSEGESQFPPASPPRVRFTRSSQSEHIELVY